MGASCIKRRNIGISLNAALPIVKPEIGTVRTFTTLCAFISTHRFWLFSAERQPPSSGVNMQKGPDHFPVGAFFFAWL